MTTPLYTTLNNIRKNEPCEYGWKLLLKHLSKTQADDEPLLFETILDSNGLDDALWCCRAAPEHNRLWRLFAVWCARQVQYLMDSRSVVALDVAERHANGNATDSELVAARDAALEAARDAAWEAARDAAWEAAWEAACLTARAAAWGAARDAAREAARAAAWETETANAVWEAARNEQAERFRRVVRGEERFASAEEKKENTHP